MGSRIPIQQYNLRSANSYIPASLHDLNTVDGPGEIIESMVDRDAVTDDSLDNDDHASSTMECIHEGYGNSLPIGSVTTKEDRSSLDNSGLSGHTYSILSIDDVSPIETARARFLDIVVDHFVSSHVIEVPDSEVNYVAQSAEDKFCKRKSTDIEYEGDARFVLPLMYVANLYETLANEVNIRLSSLNGIRAKTIRVALEAAGGLYRKLAKKFPRKGSRIFKRRELATSFETRSRFPELVIQEEKRVRFVVINGLEITEKPTTMNIDDGEWFKRLTGRSEVAVSARDYKFYAPRHKYRRVVSNSVSSIPGIQTVPGSDNSSPMSATQGYRSLSEPQNLQQTLSKQHMQNLSHQEQFHPVTQNHHSLMNQNQFAAHFSQQNQCGSPSRLPEIARAHKPSTIAQHMACLQPHDHLGGRLHVPPTGHAKFCDECGAPYLRDTSKFCSECGIRRLGT